MQSPRISDDSRGLPYKGLPYVYDRAGMAVYLLQFAGFAYVVLFLDSSKQVGHYECAASDIYNVVRRGLPSRQTVCFCDALGDEM